MTDEQTFEAEEEKRREEISCRALVARESERKGRRGFPLIRRRRRRRRRRRAVRQKDSHCQGSRSCFFAIHPLYSPVYESESGESGKYELVELAKLSAEERAWFA